MAGLACKRRRGPSADPSTMGRRRSNLEARAPRFSAGPRYVFSPAVTLRSLRSDAQRHGCQRREGRSELRLSALDRRGRVRVSTSLAKLSFPLSSKQAALLSTSLPRIRTRHVLRRMAHMVARASTVPASVTAISSPLDFIRSAIRAEASANRG
jgi:hypothetical protein